MQQPEAAAAQSPAEGGGEAEEAPPKQVALAMERLARAARLIADIRLGADQILEALFVAADAPHQSPKIAQLILKEEAAMRHHFNDLHTLGRQLEESGILNGLIRSRGNSWGLHMPLVCPDGAVVAYAWKRQLAGQAGASAVDRTRLALKAFSDQKKRFFPHLEDESFGQPCGGESGAAKRHCSSRVLSMNQEDERKEEKTLSETLGDLEREAPNMKVFTYKRLDWLKRASSLSSSANGSSLDSSKEQSFRSQNKLRSGSLNVVASDLVAVIELLVPSVFRAVISLHPAGSINPDAVAFFSPDEEHAEKALQYFLSQEMHRSLSLLLDWIYNYQTLFTKACSKCNRLLTMDKSLALLLPPVYRPYRRLSATKLNPTQPTLTTTSQTECSSAYHIGCYSDEL